MTPPCYNMLMKKWQWLVAAALVVTSVLMVVLFVRDNPKTNISAVPNPAVGLITNVSKESLSLKTGDGRGFTFDNSIEGVSVDHLKEHMDKREPVSVTWQYEGTRKKAVKVDDAL